MLDIDMEQEILCLFGQLILWVKYLANIRVLDVAELGHWSDDVLLTFLVCICF
jgi:hypothetical protein